MNIRKKIQGLITDIETDKFEKSSKLIFRRLETAEDKDEIEFWKNRIFCIISFFLVFLGEPLLFYGAFLFYSEGNAIQAITEALSAIILTIIVFIPFIKIDVKKIIIISFLYLLSIMVLVHAGKNGAGMVCVACSLILSASILNKKQSRSFFIINLAFFAIITYLLMRGGFKGLEIRFYGNLWFINALAVQMGAASLIYLTNRILYGLEKQIQRNKKSKELLLISEMKHKAMIANISDVIFIADENGRLKYCSPNMEKKYGWSEVDFINTSFWDNIFFEDRDKIKLEFMSLLEKDGIQKNFEARFECKNGEIIYLEITAVNMIKDINIQGVLMNNHDITERKKREESILYFNYHDSLTGLYNRSYLDHILSKIDRENNLPISVIAGDINGLKFINDSLGHSEGDKLLTTISQIMTDCCNKEDLLFRIGGDEFLILLPKKSNKEAYKIVKKIYTYCDKYNKELSSEVYYVSISLGIATKTAYNEKIQDIMKQADDYMYRRKLLEEKSLHNAILSSMQRALFEKSQETEMHANRLAKLSKKIGKIIGLTNQQFDELELLAKLHDIGKIGVDDGILNKTGKLTEDEWKIMKKHSEIGYRIAQSSTELMPIAKYILYHHERWDGTGYPEGLKGEDIPLLSRIISVVDAYDAMTEDRVYRKGMSKEVAIEIIKSNSGSQFDPNVVEIFLGVLDIYH